MPPKQKFTREEIIDAALNIVRREGVGGITARGLGTELGTSSRPIFTAFRDMEDVLKETMQAAKTLYNCHCARAFDTDLPFKEVGMQYFRFAREEPRLFALLFMRNEVENMDISNLLSLTLDNYERTLESIEKCYGFSRQFACRSFENMFLFTHGISCLQATLTIQFTDEEVSKLLDEMYNSLHLLYKEIGGAKA